MTSGKRLAVAIRHRPADAARLAVGRAGAVPRAHTAATTRRRRRPRRLSRRPRARRRGRARASIRPPNCVSVCGGAGMGELHIGGMLNPRLALMGDFWLAARNWTDPTSRARLDDPQHLHARAAVLGRPTSSGSRAASASAGCSSATSRSGSPSATRPGSRIMGGGGARGRAVLQLRARSPAPRGPRLLQPGRRRQQLRLHGRLQLVLTRPRSATQSRARRSLDNARESVQAPAVTWGRAWGP